MFAMGLLRRKKASAQVRVGIAMSAQGMFAVRVSKPFAPRPRIESCAYYPQASEASWAQAFAELARDLSAKGLPVVIALDAELFSLFQLTLPEVPQAEMAQALKFRVRELSPIPLDDMVLDYVEVPGMRARGGERTGYCTVARLSQMRTLRDALKDSGMNLVAIDIRDMALRHLLARFQSAEENGLLLFVGVQESRLIVAGHDRLYLFRSSNLGARQLEGIDWQGLEAHAKEESANPPSPKETSSLARVEGLVLDIQRTLDFYASHFSAPPPRQVWLAPSWPFVPYLADRLATQLRLPLREIALAEAFDGTQRLAERPPDLACLALGAALRPHEEEAKR